MEKQGKKGRGKVKRKTSVKNEKAAVVDKPDDETETQQGLSSSSPPPEEATTSSPPSTQATSSSLTSSPTQETRLDMDGPSVTVDLEEEEEEAGEKEDTTLQPENTEDVIEPIREETNVVIPEIETQETIKTTETIETESIDFSSINPEDYGLQVNDDDLPSDFIYEPPPQTDLPDLYNLLATLEEGDSELVTKKNPPSLFAIPEHIPNYTRISELRLQIEDDELKQYVSRFDTAVKDDVVMLGKIPLEEIQEEERRLRDEHVLYLEQESTLARQREEHLLHREEEAKTRTAKFVKDKRADIARREELLRQREKLMLDHIHKAFRRAESQLVGTLEKRKGEVKTLYGDLMLEDGHYGGSKGRRWKVDWNKTPQPIQINLKCLRGVKDKLPAGRYVMMVSIYNRLGGHTMRWSKLKGQKWGGATLPMFHEGNFHNIELKIDQSLFTVLPAKPSLRPGMMLVFELFLLRGSVVPTDRVISWGCFPVCDGSFDVIEGKYKCSMLRGEMDADIDKHEKLEELMASDIDHWMSNLYFEVVKLPRYLAGQNEYEVELQFTSSLTSYPDRIKTGWDENRDGEDPVPGSVSDLSTDSLHGPGTSSISINSGEASTSETVNRSDATTSKIKLNKLKGKSGARSASTNVVSRIIQKDLKKHDDEFTDDDTDESDDILAIKRQQTFKPHKTLPGVYYKHYRSNPADSYFKRLYTMLPQTQVLAPRQKKKKLTHVEELEEHTFSVKLPYSGKGRLAHAGREKLNYIARQFLAEIGLSQWRSREFWGMLLLFLIIFFIRMFAHYFGQWLFLNAIEIPINKFDFYPYTVDLNYQPTLLRAREEIGVVILGPMLNILIFTLLVVFAWISPKIFGLFPDLFSKFVLSFGLMTFLNPLLILIVDCSLLRYQDQSTKPIADFAKLWWHFDRSQGSGLAGLFITLFLYSFIGLLTGAILYMYFLRLHNNGRMLDIFWRLHGEEDFFFVPYDLEMSNQELCYICRKAEKWRGEEGERRKIAVYDYIWEEDEIEESIWDEQGIERVEKKEGKKEITTHVSIHTLHLDGLRELYRHFLRLPDGAIVEVFGDVSIPGMDKDVKKALEDGSRNLEKLMGSQMSLSKIKGRQTVVTRAGFTPGVSPTLSSQSSDSIDMKKTV
ncbi:hypothetical protein SNE40_009987 [Patella caerulea]|uniref:Uncharacterized protein n=1 Tax=Patella caerulea TaxID=87958 RepID=A0AAN8JPM3_PATCE